MSRRRYNIETIKQIVDGEQPFYQSGYSVPIKKRKIGEEFIDGKGITWKYIGNDTKVRVNKQANLIQNMTKKICSVCGQNIDFSCEKLDHKIFPKTGKCYNCLESEEMIKRLDGSWESYEKGKLLGNKLGILKDFKSKVIEAITFLENDSGKMGLIMEDGSIESWNGISNPQWLIDAKEDLIKVNEEIEKTKKEITELEKTK